MLPVKGSSPYPFLFLLHISLISLILVASSIHLILLSNSGIHFHMKAEEEEDATWSVLLFLCFHGDHVRCEHCPVSGVDGVVLFWMLYSNLITLKSILRIDLYCIVYSIYSKFQRRKFLMVERPAFYDVGHSIKHIHL